MEWFISPSYQLAVNKSWYREELALTDSNHLLLANIDRIQI